jgi:hypothetical protein
MGREITKDVLSTIEAMKMVIFRLEEKESINLEEAMDFVR